VIYYFEKCVTISWDSDKSFGNKFWNKDIFLSNKNLQPNYFREVRSFLSTVQENLIRAKAKKHLYQPNERNQQESTKGIIT